MKKEIRILLLEDDLADAELNKHALREGGLNFNIARVETRLEYVEQLERGKPDLILSDNTLPAFDGFAALALAKEKTPDIPFIFVSGTLGEEMAIESLKRGATDYVLKTRLSRLVPAVHRALRESDERSERKRAEERLRESNEQLRALTVYLQYVREEERTRIAREVHDELGQSLTGMKMDLAWLMSRLPKDQKTLQAKAASMSGLIDATIQTIRRIATELRPGILDDLGLVAAIEWQANEFQTRTGIPCVVTSSVNDPILDQDLNTAFFRIFQETLTNIMRHANATRVEVSFHQVNGRLVLEVKDNGRGITEAEIHNTRSIGLLGIRERAGLLGGEVSVRGEDGKGTTVTVGIPLARSKKTEPPEHEDSHSGRPRGRAPRAETNPRG
ncbi:MAG: response regulator [Verrucomicrobia bacterium]|nr:response regulator [Verrucomicrobiota bacterium]